MKQHEEDLLFLFKLETIRASRGVMFHRRQSGVFVKIFIVDITGLSSLCCDMR